MNEEGTEVSWLQPIDKDAAGMSAATSARNVGAAAAPVVGPAQTRFAACVASVTASVPVVVTGEPPTEKIAGMDNATEVTVPPPPPDTVAGAHSVPLHCRTWPAVAPLCAMRARAREPLVISTAEWTWAEGVNVDGTLVSCPHPMLRLAWYCVTAAEGISAATIVLNVGLAATPVVGPAKNVLAVWVARVSARVPLDVTGEPPMLNILGADSATLVTVPDVGMAGAHAVPLHRSTCPVVAPDCAM